MLRYVGQTDATVWVETDEPCEVEVLGTKARTFTVGGHHFALVALEGLEPGSSSEYEVALDGDRVWPPEGYEYPAPILRTFRPDEQIELLFGSCRVAAPHEPPYTLPKDLDEENGRGFDALHALAKSVLEADDPQYPDLVFVCGDQVYADEVSIETLEFIRSREGRPPGAPEDQVCDFEEYTRLYRESWADPVIRWFWSTVSSSMVIDDHDMIDDWNISRPWWDRIHEEPWWQERVVSGLVAYWIYQFLGNLSPAELAESELWQGVQEAEDATELLRDYMARDDQERDGKRWSFYRDLGTTRLIVVDARTGRCLEPGDRKIVDDGEWEWIVERATEGEFDHLLFGTSVPWLLTRTLHNIEAWNEKVCDGAWGSAAAKAAESMRQAVDFDHWGAFEDSFLRLARLVEEIGSGGHGEPPATIGVLSGDVHHAYLADVAFRRSAGVRSHVYQAVCSPYRNALDNRERRTLKLARTRLPAELTLLLAKSVGVRDPGIRWRFAEGPYFDNQIATIELDGRSSTLKLEKVPRDPEGRDERLEPIFESRLS
jgi:hypothetical protein